MKYNFLLAALFSLISLTAYSQQDSNVPDGIVTAGNKFVMTIKTNTSRSQLESMASFLKANNIQFEIKDIYIVEGKIKGITAKVSSEYSQCSFFSDKLKKNVIVTGCFNCRENTYNMVVYIE